MNVFRNSLYVITRIDAGYDHELIYQQIHRNGQRSVIAYNKRNEKEILGYDKHFAPTTIPEGSKT